MARADIMSILYSKEKSPLEFNFDNMWIPSLWCYLTPNDVAKLYKIATSIKYNADIKMKYAAIADILVPRGFKKFHCGTNRIVYSYLEDPRFLIKVALDEVGLRDNPAEYKNQFLLKPFVTKMFEVSPCGTVATVERVQPITSTKEFESVAEDVFELLNQRIIGKYVLEDIGSKFFMNYGLRTGFGVCLLDYPYVYELDGRKLYCNKVEPNGHICDGLIDYDDGFNSLVCTKCGKIYLAKQLEQSLNNNTIILKEEGEIDMKITLRRGNEIIKQVDSSKESDTIRRDIRRKEQHEGNKDDFKVTLVRPGFVQVGEEYQHKQEQTQQTITQKLNLSDPKIYANNSTEEDKTKFKVDSKFIPQNELHAEVSIKKPDVEVKPESNVESYAAALGVDLSEPSSIKEEELDDKKSCFGKYIFEDMDCMMCKDCSVCSMEKNAREQEYRNRKKNNKRQQIDSEY